MHTHALRGEGSQSAMKEARSTLAAHFSMSLSNNSMPKGTYTSPQKNLQCKDACFKNGPLKCTC